VESTPRIVTGVDMASKITVKLAGGHTVTFETDQECTQSYIRDVLRPFENAMGDAAVTVDNFDDVAKESLYKPRVKLQADMFNVDYITSMRVEEL
jgi:hypothetical protein